MNQNGRFSISVRPQQGVVHYLIAERGAVNSAAAKQLTMLTVLSGEERKRVAIN